MKRFIAMMMAVVTMMSMCVSASAAYEASNKYIIATLADEEVEEKQEQGRTWIDEHTLKVGEGNVIRVFKRSEGTVYTTIICEDEAETKYAKLVMNGNKGYIAIIDYDKETNEEEVQWLASVQRAYKDRAVLTKTNGFVVLSEREWSTGIKVEYETSNKKMNRLYKEYAFAYIQCIFM